MKKYTSVALICNLITCSIFGFLVAYLIYAFLFGMVGKDTAFIVSFAFALFLSVFFELAKNTFRANFLAGFFSFKNLFPTVIIDIILAVFLSIATK